MLDLWLLFIIINHWIRSGVLEACGSQGGQVSLLFMFLRAFDLVTAVSKSFSTNITIKCF